MNKRIVIVFCSITLCAVAINTVFLALRYVSEFKDYKKNLICKSSKTSVTDLRPNVPEKILSVNSNGSEMKVVTSIETDPEFGTNNTINILFLGIDRTIERDKTLKVFRTDTIILAAINLDTKNVQVLSIPRDTYAYIPCLKRQDKINHAYPKGGMNEKGIKSTIDAVNNFIKYTEVDYYFSLDMEPIPQIVDELGGVELEVETDMKTYGANLSKGIQLLDGRKAFDYLHWRYSANGDIDRIKRQQKLIKAMFTKLRDSGRLISAAKLALSYSKYIKTDLSTKQLISLAAFAKDIQDGETSFYTIPGSPKYIDKISYWIPDEKKTDKLLRQFSNYENIVGKNTEVQN